MFSRLERHPEEHPDGPPVTLEAFLAVRLLLERPAIERAAASIAAPTDWVRLRTERPVVPPRAALLDAALLWAIANDDFCAGFANGEESFNIFLNCNPTHIQHDRAR